MVSEPLVSPDIGQTRLSFWDGWTVLLVSLLLCGASIGVVAGDWDAYRGGKTRQSSSPDSFPLDLSLSWSFQSGVRPDPAWPLPARKSYWQQLESITARVTDDHAFHPVVASPYVYFGSSADDHLHCLDLNSGTLRWRYGTDAPIRYAPMVSGDRIVFGGDDGVLYCLNRMTGEEVWHRRLSDRDWRIPGNGRLISSWPIRTGCVVVGDQVYVTAGLYPQQGAWAFSLEMATGNVLWRVPLDISPQGYLLASKQQLFIPAGRAQPISLNLADGSFGRRLQSLGGSFAVVDGEAMIGGRGNDGSVAITDTKTGARLSSFKGNQLAVGPNRSLLFDGQDVLLLNRSLFHEATRAVRRWTDQLVDLQQQGKRASLSIARRNELRDQRARAAESLRAAEEGLAASRRVLGPGIDCRSLLLTPSVAVIGHESGLSALDLASGASVWKQSLPEPVVSLAFAQGRLVVGTPSGTIHCFSSSSHRPVSRNATSGGAKKNWLPKAEIDPTRLTTLLSLIPVSKGFAVLIGNRAAGLARAVLERTQLKVVVLLSEAERVASFRAKALNQGLYGIRLSAHQLDQGVMPLTDHFAALVVSSDSSIALSELQRIARPHGGVVWDFVTDTKSIEPGLEGEGRWTHLYGNPANTASSGDQRVGEKLALQWFGGPGPRRMVDRHLRGSSPLYSSGILVVPGENLVVGVDAYSGEELWELDLPGSQRYSMPYDGGYMALSGRTLALAVKGECWLVRSSDGQVRERLPMPDAGEGFGWGYAAIRDQQLFGSVQFLEASRTQPSRGAIDSDYRNAQPLVVSQSLFAMNLSGGELAWQRGAGRILNPTITVGEEAVYFVECLPAKAERHGDGRLSLESLPEIEPRIVSLRNRDGRVRWTKELPQGLKRSRNILYLAQSGGFLVAVGSFLNEKNDTTYEVACFEEQNGRLRWQSTHEKGKPGETFHGEQLHHPVIVGNTLVAEPVLYDLATGRAIVSENGEDRWKLSRPGHSCGTLSASDQCLFFRAGNPTVLSLEDHLKGKAIAQKLSPTRPGCWINIIPAGGLVLIPEASAGCVCDFSLQTSMAFRPES